MEGFNFKKPAIFLLVLIIFLAGFFVSASNVKAESPPPAINYAPNFWFDSQEQYYPVNPLDFYFADGLEISGEIAVSKYNKLSLEGKLENLTVFYHIKDEGNQWVYQYWFFYVFNDFKQLVQNKHYGDWEAVFVFVNKDSKQVIKVIGTAHQRKIFDTEIYEPKNNHIWTYIGNGSHANCIDDKDDGQCDFKRWRFLEKWDKNGHKILYNNYILKEINLDFTEMFKGITTLEKSVKLGINLFDIVKIKGKEFYIPIGGNPSTYAWEQSSYYNPEEIRPFSWQYFKDKINNLKNKIIDFFKNLIAKILALFKEPIQFQADISSLIEPEDEHLEEIEEESPLPEMPEILLPIKESEPELVEPIEPIEEEILVEEKKEESQPITQPESPIKPPPFIIGGGGGSPSAEPGPEPEPEPEPEPTTTPPLPPKIISPHSGDILGQQDDYATATPGFQINLIGTSTPDLSILIFVNSTSTLPNYSTTADSQDDWSQIITLKEGTNTIKVKAKDASGNHSEEISLTLIVDTIPPVNITDLSASSGTSQGTIHLSWTAPGDDESIGTADEYIIKYATSSEITIPNWDSAVDIKNELAPSLANTTENLTVSDLIAGQTYYWAIKSKDEASNISEISNCVSSGPYAQANSLVISEVQFKGGSSANDEFIEIYNPTSQSVDLSSWSIRYRGSESASFSKKNFVGGNSIPAYGYFLIANSSYNGHMTADMSHNSFQLSAVGGSIFLVNDQTLLTSATSSSIVDKIAYGSGTYLFPETSEFGSTPGEEQSLERKARATSTAELLAVNSSHYWLGNNWDSNNNNQDFVLQTNPNPQNSLSLTEPRSSFAGLADTAWPMFQHDVRHTGLSAYTGTATGTPTSIPKWTVNLGATNPTSPVIGLDGSIYIGAGNGDLYKITTSGSVSTFYDAGTSGSMKMPALSSDGVIYVVYNNYPYGNYLYALTSDGQLIWRYLISADPSEPVIDSDGTIYISDDSCLYALTPNGERIWRNAQLSNGRWVTSVTIDNQGNIYATGQIGSLASVYKLNPDSGEIITSSSPRLLSNTPSSLDNQGNLYVSAKGGYHGGWGLSILDSSNLDERYFVSNIGKSMSTPAIGSNGIIYVGSQDYQLHALNSEGISQWPYLMVNTQDEVNASPIIDAAGIIYIGSNSKMFYAINPDGTVKWQAELSDKIQYGAVIGSDGTVYVVTVDGNLSAFGE